MKTITMPGFTAEESLCSAKDRYRVIKTLLSLPTRKRLCRKFGAGVMPLVAITPALGGGPVM